MKSALPGLLLVVAGALVTYWSLTKLGLLVPKTSTSGSGSTGATRVGGTGGT